MTKITKKRADEPASGRPQNVKTRGPQSAKKHASKPVTKFERTTFRTSREMDFFSKKELITQTGHAVGEWPLVIVKELIDNGLDACEEADIAPVIDVTADSSGITVRDNGPGLPESTLAATMNFTVRASNREAYVAPDRGAQGNGLKTILSMPGLLDPKYGKLIVDTHGQRHVITCGVDPIAQRPIVRDEVTELPTGGTAIRLEWSPLKHVNGGVAWPFDESSEITSAPIFDHFYRIVEGMAIFNPHATVRLNWFGAETTWPATDPNWQKWKPHRPTSAHWYERSHLERLIAAYFTHDRDSGADRLISEFVAEFDGLSGSQKRSQVLHESDLHRVRLSELVVGDHLDGDRIGKLLASMQRHTRPVNPKLLGIIGEEHLRSRLLALGILPESFRYSRKLSSTKCKNSGQDSGDEACFNESVPWVLESAFGWLGKDALDDRRIFAGANWSAAIHNPFRTFGATGEGLEAELSDLKVGQAEPIVFVLHLAHPRIEYTDRGKSALVIGGGE